LRILREFFLNRTTARVYVAARVHHWWTAHHLTTRMEHDAMSLASLFARWRQTRQDGLGEARKLNRRGHHAAAVMVAEAAVRHAMADLVVKARPEHSRFYSGKRLTAFLQTERIIDGKLADALRRFSMAAFDAAYRAVSRDNASRIIDRAELLRDCVVIAGGAK
jgi:HEPN domain-containing protein